MIKNNLLGQILIGLLVLFLLISSIQMFGLGQGIDQVIVDEENQMNLPSVPYDNPKEDNNDSVDGKKLLSSIVGRPMFSITRTPFVSEEPIDPEAEGVEEAEINELQAKLTGVVVITPEHSYAMILDNVTNQRETYKIGMPLDGEQGGWTLSEIHSRKVVFISDDERTAELELEVFSGKLKAGGKKKNIKKNKKNADVKQLSRKDKKKNADDIRKKIAERRAQMRAEAAKKN